jgi:hypothetical protein
MTHQPKYVLIRTYGHYAIVNDDANFIAGRVDLDAKNRVFRVTAADDCSSDVGVVGTLSEAIPALANFYKKIRRNGMLRGLHSGGNIRSTASYV